MFNANSSSKYFTSSATNLATSFDEIEGFAANLVLVDLERQWTVRGQKFASKGKFTPLEGKKLFGFIKETFFNGNIVFSSL